MILKKLFCGFFGHRIKEETEDMLYNDKRFINGISILVRCKTCSEPVSVSIDKTDNDYYFIEDIY